MKTRKIIICLLCAAALLCLTACESKPKYEEDTIQFAPMDNGEYELISSGRDTSYEALLEYVPAEIGEYTFDESFSPHDLEDRPGPYFGSLYLGQDLDDAMYSMFGEEKAAEKTEKVSADLEEVSGLRLMEGVYVSNTDNAGYRIAGVYAGLPFWYTLSIQEVEGKAVVYSISLKFADSYELERNINQWVTIRDNLIEQIGPPVHKLADDVVADNPFAALSAEELLAQDNIDKISNMGRLAVGWGDSRYYTLVLGFDVSAAGQAKNLEIVLSKSFG